MTHDDRVQYVQHHMAAGVPLHEIHDHLDCPDAPPRLTVWRVLGWIGFAVVIVAVVALQFRLE